MKEVLDFGVIWLLFVRVSMKASFIVTLIYWFSYIIFHRVMFIRKLCFAYDVIASLVSIYVEAKSS